MLHIHTVTMLLIKVNQVGLIQCYIREIMSYINHIIWKEGKQIPTHWLVHCAKTPLSTITSMLATSKKVLFPGHNPMLTTGTDDPSL